MYSLLVTIIYLVPIIYLLSKYRDASLDSFYDNVLLRAIKYRRSRYFLSSIGTPHAFPPL